MNNASDIPPSTMHHAENFKEDFEDIVINGGIREHDNQGEVGNDGQQAREEQ